MKACGLRPWVVAAWTLALGCGGGNSNPDAAPAIDGAPPVGIIDAAGYGLFTEPVEVPTTGLVNVYSPTLSDDARMIVVVSTTTGAGDLYAIVRDDQAASYGAPALIASINSPSGERDPWISPDAGTILFSSDRAPSDGFDIWQSAMPAMGSTPTPTQISMSMSGENEFVQWVSSDGQQLLYFVEPAGGDPSYYAWGENGGGQTMWSPGFAVAYPTLNGDASTLVFERNGDLMMAEEQAMGAYSPPFLLADVNSAAEETSPSLSPDGEYLAFISNRSGSYGLYLAQRRPASAP